MLQGVQTHMLQGVQTHATGPGSTDTHATGPGSSDTHATGPELTGSRDTLKAGAIGEDTFIIARRQNRGSQVNPY